MMGVLNASSTEALFLTTEPKVAPSSFVSSLYCCLLSTYRLMKLTYGIVFFAHHCDLST